MNLPAEWLAHLKRIAELGGRKNSPAQQKQRRSKAVRAMLAKRFPNDERWKTKPE